MGPGERVDWDAISGSTISGSFDNGRRLSYLRERAGAKGMEEFVLWDMGTHILDVSCFLFGEADRLNCEVHQIHQDIKGEDIAAVTMHKGGKTTVICELGYAENCFKGNCFPASCIFAEGDKSPAESASNAWIRITTNDGAHSQRCPR